MVTVAGRRRRRGLLSIGVLTLLLSCAGSAYAKGPVYAGPGTQPGHPMVGMDFSLTGGKKCPGPDCLKHAKVTDFLAVSFGFPICPVTLLEDGFEWKTPMKVKRNRTFSGGGTVPDTDFGNGDVVTISGKFNKKGKTASGTFLDNRGGCLTGTVPWHADLQ